MLSDSPKRIVLSPRHRQLLRNLLAQNLRKCSKAALDTAERRGWTSGEGDAYRLTDFGRALAEFSEQARPEGKLEFDLSQLTTSV